MYPSVDSTFQSVMLDLFRSLLIFDVEIKLFCNVPRILSFVPNRLKNVFVCKERSFSWKLTFLASWRWVRQVQSYRCQCLLVDQVAWCWASSWLNRRRRASFHHLPWPWPRTPCSLLSPKLQWMHRELRPQHRSARKGGQHPWPAESFAARFWLCAPLCFLVVACFWRCPHPSCRHRSSW